MAIIESELLPEVELDDEQCVYCGEESVQVDRHNLPWCEACDHRRRALDWGERHNWPAQRVWNIDEEAETRFWSIDEGVCGWQLAILLGPDDLVWSLLTRLDAGMDERQPRKVTSRLVKIGRDTYDFVWDEESITMEESA